MKNKKYAVVRISGKQYIVSEKDEILVDKLVDKVNEEVLLVVDDGKVSLGKPILDKAKVSFKVLTEMEKGKKVKIFKYKAKSRYRRRMGFRPQYSRLLVEKITS